MIKSLLTHSVRKCGIYDEADGTYVGYSNYDATIALVNRTSVDYDVYWTVHHWDN